MIKNPYITKDMAVAVMGLGVSGRAAVRYLHWCGARVYVSDSRLEKQLSSAEISLLRDYCEGYETGGHTAAFLKQGKLIFLSPGIPRKIQVLQENETKKIPVVGELALAAPVLQSKVVAITGTNGKTTLTTLVGELLRRSGLKVFVGGNIGRPLFEYLMDSQDADVVVLELSSFQLELAGEFHPDMSVLLNISPDHLDRHGDLQEYIRAKSVIFRTQKEKDLTIVGGDDPICRDLIRQFKHLRPLFFGSSEDCQSQICGSDIYVKLQTDREKYSLKNTIFDNYIGRLNSSAAILTVRALGITQQSIQQGLIEFQPLPHRMQIVDEIDGVRYCNDSKATNTGAVISALQQIRGEVILIAGGRDKGDNFKLLEKVVRMKVKKLVLIGEAAVVIADQLGEAVEYRYAKTMKEAVVIAKDSAIPGQTVLLSPACASFDMFDSYGHRGDVFEKAVQQLKTVSIEN